MSSNAAAASPRAACRAVQDLILTVPVLSAPLAVMLPSAAAGTLDAPGFMDRCTSAMLQVTGMLHAVQPPFYRVVGRIHIHRRTYKHAHFSLQECQELAKNVSAFQ
jgi:hypothetical protein